METALVFEMPVAGKEVKLLIDRHCNKDLVFYSVEVIMDKESVAYQFMTFDKQDAQYKFVPSPNENMLAGKEEDLSAYILKHFHSYCLN